MTLYTKDSSRLFVPNGAHFIEFTAQTRMSGVDLPEGQRIRKGAADAIIRYVQHERGQIPPELQRQVDAAASQGATPLVVAAEVNNLEAIKALVAAGADAKIATKGGTTALILSSGAGTDVQRTRTLEERATALDTAKFLVEHGVDVNAVGQFGWTALH